MIVDKYKKWPIWCLLKIWGHHSWLGNQGSKGPSRCLWSSQNSEVRRWSRVRARGKGGPLWPRESSSLGQSRQAKSGGDRFRRCSRWELGVLKIRELSGARPSDSSLSLYPPLLSTWAAHDFGTRAAGLERWASKYGLKMCYRLLPQLSNK